MSQWVKWPTSYLVWLSYYLLSKNEIEYSRHGCKTSGSHCRMIKKTYRNVGKSIHSKLYFVSDVILDGSATSISDRHPNKLLRSPSSFGDKGFFTVKATRKTTGLVFYHLRDGISIAQKFWVSFAVIANRIPRQTDYLSNQLVTQTYPSARFPAPRALFKIF